jgi:hypothetical protein
MELDLGEALGATQGSSTQRLTLYIPDKDKEGRKVKNLGTWVKEARELLGKIGGGSTALPPADGTWINEKGKTIWEQTTIIYCFIIPERFRDNLASLREFLHRYGRETDQGEVVAEFDGEFFRITKYDLVADE